MVFSDKALEIREGNGLRMTWDARSDRRTGDTTSTSQCVFRASSQTIIVARTDAEAASLLDNNVDPRDHPFILGATVPGTR